MKKSQITRDGSKRSSLENRCYHQELDVCINVNTQKKHSERTRKSNSVMKYVRVVVLVVALLSIAINVIECNAQKNDLEAYHAEQFEKMARNESEETNTPDDSIETEELDFDFQDVSVLVKASELITEEVVVTDNETQELPKEPEIVFLSNEEAPVEEYKPKKLIEYQISANGPYEHFVYILSEEDMKNIAKLVWVEARGECYEGKVAVAAVVLNRYFSENSYFYRGSILDTLVQPAQFASIWGVTDWDLKNIPDCLKAVEDACKGWDPTREVFEQGALYFYNPNGVSGYQAEIRNNIEIMVIGNHAFHYDFEKVDG